MEQAAQTTLEEGEHVLAVVDVRSTVNVSQPVIDSLVWEVFA